MTTPQRVDVARLSVSVERLPPIERDEQMQRDYIPIPGGWEVQTKGKGSTYRIARTDDDDGERWPVTDRYLQDALTNMAHAIRADYAALLQQLAEAERAREEACGLLRDVIAWRRTVPIDETPNRKDGGIFGRIAAFLAANGGKNET